LLLLENPLDRQQDNLAELRLMYFQKLIVIVNLVENRRNKDKFCPVLFKMTFYTNVIIEVG
jgi:hypothetical protein